MKYQTLFALMIGLSSSAFSASFECAKAGTLVEKLVCQNLFLSKLDEALAKNYGDLLKSNDNLYPKKELREEQKAWILKRNDCTDAKCLVNVYSDRVDELCQFGKHRECVITEEVAKKIQPSVPPPVSASPAAPPTSANNPLEDKKKYLTELASKHSTVIKSLGFTPAFLSGIIYLQADAFNRPIPYAKFGDWLALLFESGSYSSITQISSGKSQGVLLKRSGMQSAGLLFVLDGGDIFPSHVVSNNKAQEIESLQDQIAVAMMISQAAK